MAELSQQDAWIIHRLLQGERADQVASEIAALGSWATVLAEAMLEAEAAGGSRSAAFRTELGGLPADEASNVQEAIYAATAGGAPSPNGPVGRQARQRASCCKANHG
jgi:hypothetical protein